MPPDLHHHIPHLKDRNLPQTLANRYQVKSGKFSEGISLDKNLRNIKGRIYQVKPSNQVKGNENSLWLKGLQKVNRCVGRVFVICSNGDGTEEEIYACTGFAISPLVIVTSCEALNQFQEDGSKESSKISIGKIYFSFSVDARYGTSIELNGDEDHVYEMKLIERKVDILKNESSTFNEHINLLTFVDHNYKGSDDYLPTQSNSSNLEQDCILVGYPNFIVKEHLIKDGEEENGNKMYDELYHHMDGFEKKIVTIGICQPNSDSLLTHDCPTINGMNGGPLIIYNNEDNEFFVIGIQHVNSYIRLL